MLLAPLVHRYEASDGSQNMIALCREKLNATPTPSLRFDQCLLEDHKIEANSLDVILGMSLMHLVDDVEGCLSRIHTRLKPGGRFIASTACIADTLPIFRYIGPMGKFFGFFPKLHVFSRQYLHNALLDAGFTVDYQWVPEEDQHVLFTIATKETVPMETKNSNPSAEVKRSHDLAIDY